eukprot:74396_1
MSTSYKSYSCPDMVMITMRKSQNLCWSEIIGPNNGNLTINCNESHSCSESIFNGVQSINIYILCCNNPQSCYDLSLYCPPNTNGHKHCHFAGNDNTAINLYAINGWD